MILLRNLAFARGADRLVEGASCQIHPGWKVGLVGANGCGKSSFFALLRGELHAESGDLERPPGWVVAHVAQDTPALPDAALEFTLDGDAGLRQVERDLARAEAAHDGLRIAELHGRLDEIGGYAARARAAELLHGLGFSDADLARPVAAFSGGWRVRLNLARALMCRSDLLLLDEPTNHLDLDAVLWLEGWLRAYGGTLVMISHDRDFLDAVVGHTLHIENRRMTLYAGNYTTFERTRGERLAAQQSMFEKQQREIAHLHAFVDRFRAKATKARQAQSRLKALARMEEIAAAHVDTPFTFRFRDAAGLSDPLLALEHAAAGYGDTRVLADVTLTLRPGARLGLLGRNGAGKSTLVKLLVGELAPLAGKRVAGRHLAVGYFAQHQVEQLRPDESPLQHLVRQEPATREQELRDYLGGFDFRGEMVGAPCGRFSGGEKARLVLALLIRRRPNLLLLDEPTNHLDLEMREALTLALQETEAGVVLVSHDRHLLRTTCDELWLVADGTAAPFDGDLDDYAAWLAARRAAADPAAAPDRTARREARLAVEAAKKSAQAARRPLAREAEKLEKQIAGWQGEKEALDAQLADPAFYASPDRERMDNLLKRQAELAKAIDGAEHRWLEIHDDLEQLSGAPRS
ncbi:MAG: ATP-binding cassette domain-containing protein [Candidatus Nitricoxidivorans perseverans]|uniref:Probable ATP-binding protein YheS n=1 Tax=Candidatus Nitricoxidivorans perseverans TaxID=2975601 RepID=A0AA49IX12_9PROT|nr:MAG: ATP-binding cassette domain-containing protein [Candidatus Nitricoxidivorans perseverans]